MKRTILILAILLIIGHSLTETWHIIRWTDNNYLNNNPDLFLSPSFKMELNIVYYFKGLADDLLFAILCFCLAKVAQPYSRKLFFVGFIFFVYHLADAFLFLWNFKTGYSVYIIMSLAVLSSIVILLLPIKEKKSIYKSMI